MNPILVGGIIALVFALIVGAVVARKNKPDKFRAAAEDERVRWP